MDVLLFDIDGTLLVSGGAGKAALEAALAAEFGITELRGQVAFSGRTDRAIIRDLFALHDVADTPANLRRVLTAYLGHLPASLHRHPGRVLPGIAVLLEQLTVRPGVALGLLTGNVREGARLKLGHYGLTHHFAFGGYGDDHLERDDVAHEALAAVHRHLNGSALPRQVWVIGDTPLDVRCARAIGARAAAVATGWHSRDELATAGPDLLLADLADPSPLLGALDNGGT
jgi:phosphoglycolate phosphatase-like HAD superfamily hydrolase